MPAVVIGQWLWEIREVSAELEVRAGDDPGRIG